MLEKSNCTLKKGKCTLKKSKYTLKKYICTLKKSICTLKKVFVRFEKLFLSCKSICTLVKSISHTHFQVIWKIFFIFKPNGRFKEMSHILSKLLLHPSYFFRIKENKFSLLSGIQEKVLSLPASSVYLLKVYLV